MANEKAMVEITEESGVGEKWDKSAMCRLGRLRR